MTSTKSAFAAHISKDALKELAGERYFERGLAYFRSGAVSRLEATENQISARVSGTHPYIVRLWLVRRELAWNCSCPLGADGEFCKHLVATGLAWLAHGAPAALSSPELQSAKAFIEASDKQTLAEILLGWAEREDELLAELLLAAQRSGRSDSAALKDMIRSAFRAKDFIDYDEMPGLMKRIAAIPELLEQTLESGDAKTAAELAGYAMQRGLAMLRHCDDSDGMMGDVLSEIAGVHSQAAGRGAYPPAELARRLLDLQLLDGYGFFVLDDYLPALGREGLAAYKELAGEKWKKIPPLTPASRTDRFAGHRPQLTEIMTTLARHDGDVDALIELLKRDLSEPHSYLEIVHTCSRENRHDEALKWAEEGRKTFAREARYPFHDFLVEEYQRRGRRDETIALCWERFTGAPSLRNYEELKKSAERASSWPSWQEKALSWLREARSRKARAAHHSWRFAGGGSLLVEIFLSEGNPIAALEEARSADCAESLWLQLAEALETTRPDEAISIYQSQVEPIVRMTNNDAYDRAAKLLARLRKLMLSTGRRGGFVSYVAELRVKHKAKRNFMLRLDGVLSGNVAKPIRK